MTEVANPFLPHFCSFFLSTVAEKSHLKYDVVLHQNEQELNMKSYFFEIIWKSILYDWNHLIYK